MQSKLRASIISLLLSSCGANAYAVDGLYYGKIDLGWAYVPDNKITIANNKKDIVLNSHGSGNFATGALGIGYQYENNFRSDLEMYIDDGLKGVKHFNNSIIAMKTKTYGIFANGYYDFNNTTDVTPFVTVGLGYAINKMEVTSCHNAYYKTNDSVAWQVGIGASYKVNPNITLEAGYRFMDKGIKGAILSNDSSRINIKTHKSNGYVHALLIGTRFTF